MSDLISRARVLTTTEERNYNVVAATRSPHSSARSNPITNVTCYMCNIKGHLAKDCRKHETRCYQCGECGHWARNCSGKRARGECMSASLFPHQDVNTTLPVVGIYVDEMRYSVLIDTGCSRTIVDADWCRSWRKAGVDVETIGGTSHAYCSVRVVSISTDEGNSAWIDVLVVHGKPLRFDLLLGVNAIKTLGGIVVGPTGSVQLGDRRTTRCAAISINESDFTDTFDHHSQVWTASWKGSEDHAPERLHNEVSEYPVATEIRNEYMQELHTWIDNGWLVPYPEDKLGPPKGLILLIAVMQLNKTKVRPVMDYRELNHHIDAFTANADVYAAKLHKWWQKGANVSLLDLRRAYLQIHVRKTVWPYQTVKIDGKRYCLTCLGFSLNVVPLIMKAIISAVLSQEEAVGHAASAYIDDIYVNKDVVPVMQFGFKCKDLEQLEDSARLLGLTVGMEHGELRWMWGNIVPEISMVVTRWTVFSLCGRLVRHIPMCGWLHVAGGVFKRQTSLITKGWDDETKDTIPQCMMFETIEFVQQDDPARGDWCVDSKELNVWANASSLAIGVALE